MSVGSFSSDINLNSPNVRGASIDATLSSPNSANPNELIIKAKRKGGNFDSSIKSYHVVQWNGKKYRLTHQVNDGTDTRQSGFTGQDWEKIAREQVALWEKAKEANPQFTFSHSNFHVESKTWKFRPLAGRPIETIDFNDPATASSPHAPLQPLAHKTHELFTLNQVKIHPMQQLRGNPPRPTLAAERRPQQPPAPPVDPLNVPPPPPPEEPNWFKRQFKKIFG